MLPAQPNQSLIDGLACLQAIAGAREPVGVRELGRELGLEPTRVNRLLRTLAHLELAQQTADRKYVAGPGIHVLAAQSLFASGLLRRAAGPLEGLGGMGFTVAMGVLWRDHVSYLYHASAGMKAAEALGRAGLFPATRSPIGLVLLAARPASYVKELYEGREIAGFTSMAALQRALSEARERRFAHVSRDAGRAEDAVAVPVGEPAYAALALAGEISPARARDLAGLLHKTAAAIINPTTRSDQVDP